MTLKPMPRIRVDFNELVGPDLVLLAKSDLVRCEDGRELVLQPGRPVIAIENNQYADGANEYLYARGLVERNDPTVNGEWTRNAKWCCRINGGVHVSESPI